MLANHGCGRPEWAMGSGCVAIRINCHVHVSAESLRITIPYSRYASGYGQATWAAYALRM